MVRAYGRLLSLSLLALSAPAQARAQDVLTLTDRESLYLAARGEHQSALQTLEVLMSRYNRAAQEFAQARASGDQDRINTAFTEVTERSREVLSQERRVAALEVGLQEARRSYREALSARLDSLLGERDRTQDPQELVELAVLLTEVNNRYQELLQEEEDPRVRLEPDPDIPRDPRDGPEDLRRKAAQLEFRATQYEALLREIDLRLGEFRQTLRRNRDLGDFLTGLDRYGDTRLPVVPPGARTVPPTNPGQGPPGADTAGGGGSPLTLEERIANLEADRERVVERIRQTRARAEEFRGGGFLGWGGET